MVVGSKVCELTDGFLWLVCCLYAGIFLPVFRVQIITEADCFVGSLLAMEKTHTKDELFIPPSAKSSAAMQDFQKQLQEIVEKVKSNTALGMDSKLGKDIVEDRPRLLVMAGSGSGIFQVGLWDMHSECRCFHINQFSRICKQWQFCVGLNSFFLILLHLNSIIKHIYPRYTFSCRYLRNVKNAPNGAKFHTHF